MINSNMMGFVYKWTNQITSEWYIGSRKGTTDDGYRHSSKPLAAAEKKYGIENFTREILFEGNYEKDQIRSVIEADYLRKEDAANNPMSYNKTNITGPNCISEETRKKMSDAHTGKHVSTETRKRLSDALIGRSYEDLHGKVKAAELKDKLSASAQGRSAWNKGKRCPYVSEYKTGKKHTVAAITKMSKAKIGSNNPMYGKIPANRKPVQVNKIDYISVKEAAKSHNVITDTIRYWIRTGKNKAKYI